MEKDSYKKKRREEIQRTLVTFSEGYNDAWELLFGFGSVNTNVSVARGRARKRDELLSPWL